MSKNDANVRFEVRTRCQSNRCSAAKPGAKHDQPGLRNKRAEDQPGKNERAQWLPPKNTKDEMCKACPLDPVFVVQMPYMLATLATEQLPSLRVVAKNQEREQGEKTRRRKVNITGYMKRLRP
jgi:hypothetical protein